MVEKATGQNVSIIVCFTVIALTRRQEKMITHIRMKNFKSWKDSSKVQLAPLTGFFGTNSSGKSSPVTDAAVAQADS